MEKQKCPYCNKLISSDVCEYCNQKTSDYSEENKDLFDFDIAVLKDDINNINKIGPKVSTKLTDYFMKVANKEKIDYSIYSDKELLAIADYEKSILNIESYIKNKDLLNVNSNFNVELINEVEIKYEEKEDFSKKDGKTYIIIGLVSSVVMILLSLLIQKDIRIYFLTILLIIPSLIFSNGVLKFTKYSKIKQAVLSFLFILLISYIGLIYINTNFIKHLEDVVLSIYYILKYYADKGAISWKYMEDMNLKN